MKRGTLQQIAHWLKNWKKNKKKNYLKMNKSNIDGYTVKIENFEEYCIFDSGSSINIISNNLFKKKFADWKKVMVKEPTSVKLLNNSEIRVSKAIECKIEYNGNKFLEEFFIIENCAVDLLIGNDLISKFRGEKVMDFPLECPIKTRGDDIVSGIGQ